MTGTDELSWWLAQNGSMEVTIQTGVVVLFLALVSVVLGLYIAYQAYRGYRRNRSRPMLFLAAGIVLLTFVPAVISTVVANVELITGSGLILGMVSRIFGLLSILYAIKYA